MSNLNYKNTMKLKIFFVVIILAIVCFGIFNSKKETTNMDELVKTNIEALASFESQDYSCEPPYTIKCSQEGSQRIPGYKK